jgi:hypothetical protein
LDLSVLNHNLPKESLANSADFEKYIESYLTSNNAKLLMAVIMKREIFISEALSLMRQRNKTYWFRFVDKAGTPIYRLLMARSQFYFAGFGDYGPIILEHHIENETFYTLYGHLSLDGLDNIEIGTVYIKRTK